VIVISSAGSVSADSALSITQQAPFEGSVTTVVSATFTDSLATSGSDVSFSRESSPEFSVNSAGKITTTGELAVGTYTISGTDWDGSGDTGSWGYILTVTAVPIAQDGPFGRSTTAAASATFTGALVTSGSGVVFSPTSNAELSVSSAGKITTTGELAVGTDTIAGTDSDGFGDTGSWGYILTVNPVTIVQEAPFGSSVTTGESATFTDTLATNGSGVIFSPVSNAELAVSSTGKVTTSGAALGVGTYTISGMDSDGLGDTGSWYYTLTVTAAPAVTVGGPPKLGKVQPGVFVAAVKPWISSVNHEVHFRIHLYGGRGPVSGTVSLELNGKTFCTPTLVRGVGHCTASSSKFERGTDLILVDFQGSGPYKSLKRLVSVDVR
jgi:hypothetical protein